MPFDLKTLNNFVVSIKNGEMTPNTTFKSIDFVYKITVLHAALIPNYSVTNTEQLELVKKLIALGCDVDILTDHLADTPLEYAAKGAKFLEPYQIGRLVDIMLPHHKKGTRDVRLMQCAEQSGHYDSFKNIITSKYIDVNDGDPITKNTILHYLSMMTERSIHLGILLLNNKELNPNPINSSGNTPFTVALNAAAMSCVVSFAMDKQFKIVGKLYSPEVVIDYDLCERFVGHFFKEYPEMISYAIKKRAYKQLPANLADIFLF